MANKLKYISFFSGAGCFDIGFREAGFDSAISVDNNMDSCRTLELNDKAPVICSGIENINSEELLKKSNLKKRHVDLIIGGPPCQPFSKCSYGALGSPLGFEDYRANTILQYMRMIREILPKAFVIENVPHFITGKNSVVKDYLKRSLYYINRNCNTNYKLNIISINAAHYGVPQIRERIFIIASRDGLSFTKPEINFNSIPDKDLELEYYRTTWDAIGHLSNLQGKSSKSIVGGKWGSLLTTIPPGKNYLWHTEKGGGKNLFKWRSRYWNFLLKLHPNLPSWTIPAQPGQFIGPFHWENRKLTIREAALIQTVPEQYNFYGSQTSVRKQIGNGVPSALGELLGKEIRKQFFGDRVHSYQLKLIPKKRRKSQKYKNSISQKFHLDVM